MGTMNEMLKRNFCSCKGHKRIFGLIALIVSSWTIVVILITMWKRFETDSISIGIETTHLHWNTPFPAVSICLSKNRSSNTLLEFIRLNNISFVGSENNFAKNIHEYIFLTPNTIQVKAEYCKGLNSTCGVNVMQMRTQILPTKCDVFIKNLTFSSDFYSDCKQVFKFHDLSMGYCFIANHILDYSIMDKLPLRIKRSNTKQSINFYLQGGFPWKYEVYVHSPVDLPFSNSISHNSLSDPSIFSYNVEEFYNGDDVISMNIKQRKCKFPNERIYASTFHYSFSTCMIDLRINMELQRCNCTLFTSPPKYANYFCDIFGIKCVSQANIPATAKDVVGKRYICFPSCEEQLITYVSSSEIVNKQRKLNGLFYAEIEILNTPTLRYNRVKTQTYMDLVVSIGGVLGLFLGASLLNIIELAYQFYLLIK